MCVTLTLILLASRTGNIKLLYWLPLMFVFWANLHVQFIYGLAVLGLFVGTIVVERVAAHFGILPSWWPASTLPVRTVIGIFAGCVAATLVGPYSFHLYQEAYSYSKAKIIYSLVTELQAIDFRSSRHYVQLVLTAAAFAAIGWQKKVNPFKLLLLMMASVVAYRAVRESWFICIPAVACIADSATRQETSEESRQPALKIGFACVIVLGLLLVLAPTMGFDRAGLAQAVSQELPVHAADYIRQNKLPGPLYNTFRWGAFLIWYLPEYPVAIDGRTDLYGDAVVERFTKTAWGVSYATDPDLTQAGVILVQQNVPLTRFLAADPHYEMVYHDEVAAVFRPR